MLRGVIVGGGIWRRLLASWNKFKVSTAGCPRRQERLKQVREVWDFGKSFQKFMVFWEIFSKITDFRGFGKLKKMEIALFWPKTLEIGVLPENYFLQTKVQNYHFPQYKI